MHYLSVRAASAHSLITHSCAGRNGALVGEVCAGAILTLWSG